MPVRTAAQYMESLKDDRSIYIEGERIKAVSYTHLTLPTNREV